MRSFLVTALAAPFELPQNDNATLLENPGLTTPNE